MITFAFILKTVLSFFNVEHVSFNLDGNMHYTDLQIYDALGSLQNIVIDSEKRMANHLKENLSYIKDVHVTKHVMKRMLTIEVTEREPFAILKFDTTNDGLAEQNSTFFLVDGEGYVLQYIDSDRTDGDRTVPNSRETERPEKLVVLIATGSPAPKVGTAVETQEIALGLTVLKTALLSKQSLATQIESIDASDPRKIKLRLDDFSAPAWIAADAIEAGLHHIHLFLKQHKTKALKLINENSDTRQPYLDARFEDTIYLGGLAESQ